MTRTEALLAALQQVGDNISGVDDRLDQAINILESNRYEHAAEMRAALEEHGKNIKGAGESLMVGLIASTVIGIGSLIFSKIIDVAIQRGKSDAQIIQLVTSIFSLQQRHGPMDYNFILERSYAEGTTTDERRTLINGLVASGLLEDDSDKYQGKLVMNDDLYDEFIQLCLEGYGLVQIENDVEQQQLR